MAPDPVTLDKREPRVLTERAERDPTWLRTEATIALRLMILTVAVLFAIWLALQVRVITVAAFLAFAQAALLWPVTQRLSRYLPRAFASMLVVAAYLALITALIWFIIIEMVNAWPMLVRAVVGSAEAANEWFLHRGWALPPDLVDDLQRQATSRVGTLFSGIGEAALSGLGIAGQGATIMLVATFATLFALIGGPKIVDGLLSSVTRSRRANVAGALRNSVTAARWWMLASTVTGGVDGLLIGFGMHLMEIPLAVPIGLATFILGFIPLIGATVAGAIAVAVALFFEGVSTAAATLVLVLAVQQIEGNVLSPLLLSRAMQFPPLVTLLLSTTGGAAFGVIGLFLAVPAAGIATAAVKGWRGADESSEAEAEPEAKQADEDEPDAPVDKRTDEPDDVPPPPRRDP